MPPPLLLLQRAPATRTMQRAAGLGMDVELVERLEREILDLAPAVKWEDIAVTPWACQRQLPGKQVEGGWGENGAHTL